MLKGLGLAAHAAGFPVVAIGASAGGLEVCKKLLDALPAGTGMAFVLVQHLDPTQESLLVDLLAKRTPLTVLQAVDTMPVEREHLYVIPPGTYLSVQGGALHLSPPKAPRGARLPFDFLPHSLAEECGPRAACVVLSGTGADGSLGLRAVKEAGGRVFVQDPEEAGYDGMPRSAIATGLADAVLPAADIPGALAGHGHRAARPAEDGPAPASAPESTSVSALATVPAPAAADPVAGIIGLLLAGTRHDFAPYKRGTLERRIERRMALSSLRKDETARYLDKLRGDPGELALLGRDLLIHVTGFFRDPQVYAALARTVIPGLLDAQAQGGMGSGTGGGTGGAAPDQDHGDDPRQILTHRLCAEAWLG